MAELLPPLIQALTFGLGCLAILALRGHAERLGAVLAAAAAGLAVLLLMAATVQTLGTVEGEAGFAVARAISGGL